MQDLFAGIRDLTLPFGAGPGERRIFIGPDLPPPLDTYVFQSIAVASSGIIFYPGGGVDTSYTFLVNVGSVAFGTVVYMGHVRNGSVREVSAGNPYGQKWSADTTVGPFPVTNDIVSTGSGGSTLSGLVTVADALAIAAAASWTVDGVSAGRGWISSVAAQSDSAAIGAETAVLTDGTSRTFKNGRAFALIYGARFAGSVANTVVSRLRKNTAAGTEILAFSHPLTTADQWFSGENVFVNTSGSDVTFAPCFTIGATAGTATMRGATTIPRYIRIYDIGASGQYTNYPSV